MVLRTMAEDPNWTKDSRGGFAHLPEYYAAVRRAFVSGGRDFDERLKPLAVGKNGPYAAVGSDENAVFSDPHGGFLQPVALLSPVKRVPIGPLAETTPLTMPAPIVKIPARVDKDHSTSATGGITVSRQPEAVETVASRAKVELLSFEALNLIGLTFASNRLTDGAPVIVEEWLSACFADATAYTLWLERLSGSGVGESLGVVNDRNGCLITVAKEGGQAADTIVKANIDKMEARCWQYARASWIANHNTREQLKGLVQVVGTGGSAVPYLTCVNSQELLDGRPIYFTDLAKTLGDKGDIVLGVWEEYVDGTYLPLTLAASLHVRFIEGEVAFRIWSRGFGRPWWTAPLTPKHGSATLSPFLTLAERA